MSKYTITYRYKRQWSLSIFFLIPTTNFSKMFTLCYREKDTRKNIFAERKNRIRIWCFFLEWRTRELTAETQITFHWLKNLSADRIFSNAELNSWTIIIDLRLYCIDANYEKKCYSTGKTPPCPARGDVKPQCSLIINSMCFWT